MNWALIGLSFATGTLTQYLHQTGLVDDVNYPITPPVSTVSIVIPAYNEEAFIENTLNGILTQNIVVAYPEHFEIIVVDNGSTDNTVQAASPYATVISSQPGKLNAKDTGVQYASGDIVVFIDADVDIHPNALNLLLRHLHKSSVVAVCGVAQFTYVNLFESILFTYLNQINGIAKIWMGGGFMAVWKDAYYAVGGHDLAVDQFSRYAIWREEELEFAQRLKKIGNVVVDTTATIFVEPREIYCRTHLVDETCNSPFCKYCREARQGQRF